MFAIKPQRKTSNARREVLHWLIKVRMFAEGQLNERSGKMIQWRIKAHAQREMSKSRGKIINCLVEIFGHYKMGECWRKDADIVDFFARSLESQMSEGEMVDVGHGGSKVGSKCEMGQCGGKETIVEIYMPFEILYSCYNKRYYL